MEYENHYASKGVAGTGLGLGIAGTALGLLGGNGLGNILGGNNAVCSEDHFVNRYEASQSARIAELETEVKLRDANTYTLGEMNKMRNYVDERFTALSNELCRQSVINQKTEDAFLLVRQDIQRERDERCCGDNAIINYSNATFYPKMVADVTTGTTTTAQSVYNPIPGCNNCCK